MPKMGEGVIEATILKWVKKVGEPVIFDETIVEIATDKVDSEIPSPVDGTIRSIHFQENEVVPVGKVIAVIETEAEVQPDPSGIAVAENTEDTAKDKNGPDTIKAPVQPDVPESPEVSVKADSSPWRHYSPLVKSMAKAENISREELDTIEGSGQNGKVIRRDIEAYLSHRSTRQDISKEPTQTAPAAVAGFVSGDVEIIEMDRMRKLIADYMVESKRTSPHVTSIVEADMTNIVRWRNNNKELFFKKYNQKLTFTPIFIHAIVRAILDFPMINVSVEGSKIIVKKNIHIGMATALPSGNLIVPVIKNADRLSLAGLATVVNDLAERARTNKLKPDEIVGGTYTLTNLGSFGNLIGTPIINQPQVAIMATGAIKKKPAVLETEDGDVIAIRHMMYLSHAYDHRVVDGYLGGSFVRRVADYLEQFDHKQAL